LRLQRDRGLFTAVFKCIRAGIETRPFDKSNDNTRMHDQTAEQSQREATADTTPEQ
jgi:hypothetical protein